MRKTQTARKKVYIKYIDRETTCNTPVIVEDPLYNPSSSFIGNPRRFLEDEDSFRVNYNEYLRTHTPTPQLTTTIQLPKLHQLRRSPDHFLQTFNSTKSLVNRIILKASKAQLELDKERQMIHRFRELKSRSHKLYKLKNLSPMPLEWTKPTYHQPKFMKTTPTTYKTSPVRSKAPKCPLRIQELNPEIQPPNLSTITTDTLKKIALGFNRTAWKVTKR